MFNRIEITSERIPSKSLILDYATNLQNEKIDQNNIIIYGRNGTGKSTLCREIGKLKLNEESDIKEPANVNFYTDKELKNDSINTENIYVYNDDFQKKYGNGKDDWTSKNKSISFHLCSYDDCRSNVSIVNEYKKLNSISHSTDWGKYVRKE